MLYATLAKHFLIFVFSILLALFVSHLLVDALTVAPCFASDNHIINTSILTSRTTTL